MSLYNYSKGLFPSGTPIIGGASTRILFNDAGTVGESAGLTYDKTTSSTTVTGNGTFGGTVTAGSSSFLRWNGTTILSAPADGALKIAKTDAVTAVTFAVDAANTLALRNGTSAQAFNLYGTYTDASNYERALLSYDSGNSRYQLVTQKLGTGADRDFFFQGGTSSGFVYSRTATDMLQFGQDGVGTYWKITTSGHFLAGTDNTYDIGASGASRPRNVYVGNSFSVGSSGFLTGEASANVLALRNSTSPQIFRLYNTYTDSSNYERGFLRFASNILEFGTEQGGTGSARALFLRSAGILYISTNGSGSAMWNFGTTGHLNVNSHNTYDIGASGSAPRNIFAAGYVVTGAITVASLPAAATAGAGARLFVTDANATTYNSIVAAGGANKVPVVSDGANWRIG